MSSDSSGFKRGNKGKRLSFAENVAHPPSPHHEENKEEVFEDEQNEVKEEAPPESHNYDALDQKSQNLPSSSDIQNGQVRKRSNSLALRKLPVHVLLAKSEAEWGDDDDLNCTGDEPGQRDTYDRSTIGNSAAELDSPNLRFISYRLLRGTCLNPDFTLRTQMMLSFGLVSAFAIGLVVAVCIVVSVMSGNAVTGIARQSFEDYALSKEGVTARYIAESLTLRLLPSELIQLLYEVTRDRFAGYPIFEDDSQVPFFDTISQTNQYPIRGKEPPMDWQIVGQGNVNEETQYEHVQNRWSWYKPGDPLSTENAVFSFQGNCDPNVKDPSFPSYWPNCSDANNDVTTGGVISPSPTAHQVYQKAKDLGPILKSLYEFYRDVKELGIYFFNGGSGAYLTFPHYQLNTSTSYVSIGCNWLLEPHPYDPSRSIGSIEDHARCESNGVHLEDQEVSSRLYSPMDRGWCRHQALHPEEVVTFGPYKSVWPVNHWTMSIGRAVYDRVTQEFIGCIGVAFTLDLVVEALAESKVTPHAEITLVRLDDNGTVVASTAWNMIEASENVVVNDLEVGVSQATYARFKQLVNFDTEWDPQEVRRTFEAFQVQAQGFSVSGYPMPPPPKTYDAFYRPEYLAISSMSERDISAKIESVSDSVDTTVNELCTLSLVVGCIGLVAVVLFIFVVAHAITLPLTSMNDVSSDIVNSFGSHNEKGIEVTQNNFESNCSPKTELSDVVKQFQKMVSRFSGSAMAKSMQVNVDEIDNRFPLGEYSARIYYSRADKDFSYTYWDHRSMDTDRTSDKQSNSVLMPSRIHFGSVINDGAKSETTTFRTSDINVGDKVLASPLFFWIVALIVAPLVITTVVISTFVTYNISTSFFNISAEAQIEYIGLNKDSLHVFSGLRAAYVSLAMRQALRDNFLLTRFATWLLFGGIERTDTFTEMLGGTDECKGTNNVRECSVYPLYTCDCAWHDRLNRDGICDKFDSDSRSQQRLIFFGLAEDILADGDRNMSSYPEVAYSAESTVWWSNNISGLPGSGKGSNASGYDTTYDRFRGISAMPIFQSLYNADQKKESFMTAMVFFEADGLGIGYAGCDINHLTISEWVSSEENRAAEIRPELCPLGKHGYDPRCRGWYDRGRKLGLINNTDLYVTPPYPFVGGVVGQSCTSRLIDPMTGEHVGQTLVDFVSRGIFDTLHQNDTPLVEGGFPIVISALSDEVGADTVLGPSFSLLFDTAVPLGDVILPYDEACPAADCKHRAGFEIIREQMKNGERGNGQFLRTAHDGSVETIHISFAPVKAKDLVPQNSSIFARGINASEILVYSLALAVPEESMVAPFASVEAEVQKSIAFAVAFLAIVIVFSTAFVLYISSRITLSLTEPMIYLLRLIVQINQQSVDGTPPGFEIDNSYGSREIMNVVETMETLYRIVQSANVAFFAGDVEKAYYVLSDAARLFKRLGNTKAESVANNNLGNTMLAFYRTMEDTGAERVGGFNKQEVIGKGVGYYHRAIQLGEKAYDDFYEAEGWSPSCLDFMQHLSNRYFNRGMFLLTVKDGHENPTELEELGMRDLQITTDMDIEIVDQGEEVGWDVRGADKRFDVILSRIRGHLLLVEMGYEDKWDLDQALENAFDLLKKELHCVSSSLFKEFCAAGRMQQIETELIRYHVIKGEWEEAAKIAIRLLVEDEKTLQEAQLKAVEALILYFEDLLEKEGDDKDPKRAVALHDVREYQCWLQKMSKHRDRRKSEYDESSQLPGSWKKSLRSSLFADSESDSPIEQRRREMIRLSSQYASTRGDVTMEVF